MIVMRPDGRLRLEEQLAEACRSAPGVPRRTIVLLAQGQVHPEELEPFATLDHVMEGLDRELQLALTDGWAPAFWPHECGAALEVADVEGAIDFSPTPDQRHRALTQRVEDGRVEVLFVERGRIVGSALTLVATRRQEGPIPLNTKLAAMELLQTARDALAWDRRSMEQLLRDAREALGIPAGTVTTIAAVREQRGEQVVGRDPRAIEDVGEMIRRAADGRARGSIAPVTTTREPRRSPGVSLQEVSRHARPVPSARSAPPAPALSKVAPEDRHAVADGRCTSCGRTGAKLSEPCGRPELGRFGLLELD